MYEIAFDRSSGILTLRFKGFWDVDDVKRCAKELTATLTTVRPQCPTFTMLVDRRGHPVQSKEVAEALGEMENDATMRPTGRVAVVVAGMLDKLQAERMSHDPLVGVFLDETEARQWLMESRG